MMVLLLCVLRTLWLEGRGGRDVCEELSRVLCDDLHPGGG